MGSHPTLDHEDLAAEALELDPVDWRHSHTVAHLAADHPQVRAWPDDNPDLAHKLDHRDWNYDHPHPTLERAAEEAFDRLNPTFGVPADRSDRLGHRNRQLWESTRNLYNLVATGALDHHEVDQALLVAAERCGLLAEEPRQTHRTLASGRQVGLAHPGRPRQPPSPERTHPSPTPPARAAGERTKEGR